MYRILFLTMVGCFVFNPASAGFSDRQDAKVFVASFVTSLHSSNADDNPAAITDVFEMIREHRSGDFDISVSAAQLSAAIPSVRKVLGPSIGSEELCAAEIGDSLYRVTWLWKFQSGPMIFEFLFYRADKEWQVGRMIFNSQLNYRCS